MDVSQISKLANINLSSQEKANLADQLNDTLNHISVINELDVSTVKPTSQVTGLNTVTRDDFVDSSRLLTPPKGGYYIVPAIFHES